MTQALAIPVLSTTDSLDSYMRQIKVFPVLTAEEEYDLATKLKQDNDLDAARKLVVSHLRLVASVARGYVGYGLPQADLIQEGNIGLMKAVKRFDPDRGVRLFSFAMHWIKAEINEYVIKNWRLVKVATTKAQRKLFFNLRSMKKTTNTLKPAEIDEIAKELNVKPEDVMEMESRMTGAEIAMESYHSDGEDDEYLPIHYLEAPEAEPSQVLQRQEEEHLHTAGLAKAIASLDERSQKILQARWLTEDKESTLHELAQEYNVSAERIRQIEQKAMQKIKQFLTA